MHADPRENARKNRVQAGAHRAPPDRGRKTRFVSPLKLLYSRRGRAEYVRGALAALGNDVPALASVELALGSVECVYSGPLGGNATSAHKPPDADVKEGLYSDGRVPRLPP